MNFKTNTFKSDCLSIFLLAFFTVITFYSVINGNESFFINFDNVEQFYAWYQKLNYALHHNYLPLWDANVFGGKCFTGEFQTGVFYPINIIWLYLFGGTELISTYALDLLVVFHFFIAAMGMYLVCRYWKLSSLSSILGAVVFAFTGALIARSVAQTAIFFGLALTPYSFLFLLKYYSTQNKKFLVLTGLFLGLQILAGHIQPFFHAVILSFSYLFYKSIIEKDSNLITKGKKLLIEYAIILIAVIITALPQLYTGMKYIKNAYRWVGAEDPVSPGGKVPFKVYSELYSISPLQLLNIFDRRDFDISDGNELFIGILPALLLISLLFVSFKKNTIDTFDDNKKYFYWVIPVSLIIMMGQYTFIPVILHKLPFVGNVRQLGRYAIVFHFLASILVAYGFEYFSSKLFTLDDKKKKVIQVITAVLILDLSYICVFQKTLLAPEVLVHLCALALIVLAVLFIHTKSIVSYIAFSIILLAIICSKKNVTSSIQSPSYPNNFFKSNAIIQYLETKYGDARVLIEADNISKNIGDVYKIQTKMGHGATINAPYFDFISQQWDRNSEVNDILNIKYIITKDTILDLPFIMRDENLGVNLYERPTAYPRVFLKSQVANRSFHQPEIFNFKRKEYSDLYQKYEITSSINDTLIFSENYYKGWNILVDSKRVEILQPAIKTYLPLQMGIVIPSGKHIVELKYNPFY